MSIAQRLNLNTNHFYTLGDNLAAVLFSKLRIHMVSFFILTCIFRQIFRQVFRQVSRSGLRTKQSKSKSKASQTENTGLWRSCLVAPHRSQIFSPFASSFDAYTEKRMVLTKSSFTVCTRQAASPLLAGPCSNAFVDRLHEWHAKVRWKAWTMSCTNLGLCCSKKKVRNKQHVWRIGRKHLKVKIYDERCGCLGKSFCLSVSFCIIYE